VRTTITLLLVLETLHEQHRQAKSLVPLYRQHRQERLLRAKVRLRLEILLTTALYLHRLLLRFLRNGPSF